MPPEVTRLSARKLRSYRQRTFRLLPRLRLRSQEEAVQFVNERGFIHFWPITGVTFPSLWAAVAGDRPVADAHDDPGHVTWRWKDALLGRRLCYYAKVLRSRATMISLDAAPYFYALSENYGDPESDYLQLYEDGQLSLAAKAIYETLLKEGPLDTVNLRKAIRMTSQASNSPFERALTELQRDFKILPVGVAETGAWRYSFIYDLVHRFYSDLPAQSRPITRREAREKLLGLYFDSVGAATFQHARLLFQWKAREVESTLASLVHAGRLVTGGALEGSVDPHYLAAKLMKRNVA